jgi:hypothetical protein
MVYSRLITMIFALFCSVTGQIQKSASSKQTTFKGTAYLEGDSGVVKNIQLYLRNCIIAKYGIQPYYGVIMPEYGVVMPDYGVSAWYGVNTTTPLPVKTDEHGKFEVNFTTTSDMSVSISSDEVIEPAGKVKYFDSGCLTIKAGVDTTYTLFLKKQTTTNTQIATDTKHQFTVTAIQGKDFRFQIPDWKGQKVAAAILNSSGQKISHLDIDADGMLCWNTQSIAVGVYFLQLQNGNNILSMKILVK